MLKLLIYSVHFNFLTMKPRLSLAFYADCPDGTKNKRFTFRLRTPAEAQTAIQRFKHRGLVIRAAWFRIAVNGTITTNRRITNL
jgi:hypothetical protein